MADNLCRNLRRCPLGPRSLQQLCDSFLYNNLSVATFVRGLKYCMIQHAVASEPYAEVSATVTPPEANRLAFALIELSQMCIV